MKKLLFLLLFLLTNSLAVSEVEYRKWQKNETFLKFLETNSLPLALWRDLDSEDKELTNEIREGEDYQILWNDDKIEQVLIPINGTSLQIHIYKDIADKYTLTFTPIVFDTQTRAVRLNLRKNSNASTDIQDFTNSSSLSRALYNAFSGGVNFHAMQEGDEILILYERKERFGQNIGIILKMASVEVNRRPSKVYKFKDTYFDAKGKEMESFLLAAPLAKYTRISSKFSSGRYHPILKKYRAHLGVDYAAPTGTPVRSAGSGVVSFAGTQSGYGKVVKITHGSGYSTLYAHLSRIATKKGRKVSQGQTIGYVGSTGLSTGAHLHFGLYLNNRAINPFSVVKITKTELKGKEKDEFAEATKAHELELQAFIDANNTTPPRENTDFINKMEF